MKILSKKGKWLLALTCVLYALDSVMIAVLTYYNAKIIEYVEAGDKNGMLWQTLICVILSLVSYLLIAIATLARLKYLSNGELEICRDIMKNIFRRPLRSFRGQEDSFYLNLLSTDVGLYRADYLNMIPFMFSSFAAVASAVYMLGRLNLWLLAAGLVAAAIPMAVIKPFSKLEQRSKSTYSKAEEKCTKALKENIEGYETIRTECGENGFEERYAQACESCQKAKAKYTFTSVMSFETLMSVAGLSNIVCIGVGGWLVMQGVMSLGMLFAACNYFSSLSNSFSNITDYFVTMRSTGEVIDRLQEQRNVSYTPDSGLTLSDNPAISYQNITFSFGERTLYHDFNQQFNPQGCYAVLGASGSGKSTLLKLLMKYHENYSGEICLGGYDIRKLSEKEIYSRIGYVSQTPYLFNAPLYENITMFGGNPWKDSAAYKDILRELNLTELAERVGDTPLGDFGDNISGGERQRINIARVMCRRPSIIIFDEPTTGLDPENVRLIDEFIFQHKNIMRIVITHNWSEDYLGRFDEVIKIQKD